MCHKTSSFLLLASELSEQHGQRIIKLVHHTLFERDDGIVGDVNLLGADLRATFGDVAETEAQLVLEKRGTVATVEWMHFEARDSNKEARAGKLLLLVVFAKNVAYILAKKTLDALSKFLHAIHVELRDFPGDTRPRFECRDFAVDTIVPGNVGDKVFDFGKAFHREDGDGLVLREIIHARLAGETRTSVDFRGAGAALPCFAIPAYGKVGGQMPLDVMERIENDHAWRDGNAVVHCLSAIRIAAENAQCGIVHV
jgi:hypothetical protein